MYGRMSSGSPRGVTIVEEVRDSLPNPYLDQGIEMRDSGGVTVVEERFDGPNEYPRFSEEFFGN